MAQTVYEGMFLLDSNRYGRDPEGVAGQIPKMIREVGGDVLISRLWEERRLAYPIKGRRKGTYWLTYFKLDGPKLAELNRKTRLSDDILRVLFIKIDPRIVDTLVEHARAGTVRPAAEGIAEGDGGVRSVDELEEDLGDLDDDSAATEEDEPEKRKDSGKAHE